MKLDRLGDITSELSTNLVRSIVLPSGFWERLSRPLAGRLRDLRRNGSRVLQLDPAQAEASQSVPIGSVVLSGAAPVPDEAIVAMVHLAGGRSARLAVIPVAAADPARAGQEGLRLFTRFGMRQARVLELVTRERAESPEWVALLESSDAVVLCGEDPLCALNALSGTAAAAALRRMSAGGKPVMGIEGGATVLAERLIVERDGAEVLTDGLGLAPGLLVDTAFGQQPHFRRLAHALSGAGPVNVLGVGLENGAAVLIDGVEARVMGEGSVTFLDPQETAAGGEPIEPKGSGALCGLKVHVLLDGYVMNLRTRRPSAPVKEAGQAVADG